jgi:hypothetical protein
MHVHAAAKDGSVKNIQNAGGRTTTALALECRVRAFWQRRRSGKPMQIAPVNANQE